MQQIRKIIQREKAISQTLNSTALGYTLMHAFLAFLQMLQVESILF